MTGPQLIGVDWGTSSLRVYLIDGEGRVLDRRAGTQGILAVADGRFEPVLAAEVADWRRAHGPLPILMSGMIGSRQGWREASYASCPADLGAVAGKLLRFETSALGPVAIIPGLTVEADGVPDVMRGEEAQVFGAMVVGGGASGWVVLPGTHAKWVRVENGGIAHFASYMTGEVYAALKDHTILGRLMTDGAGDEATAFRRGVLAGAADGGPGALLHRVFSARTLGLFDRLAGADVAAYLSGLVIGAELADAAPRDALITIVGSDVLVARYATAADVLGLRCTRAPADCVVAGHLAIARAAGLI